MKRGSLDLFQGSGIFVSSRAIPRTYQLDLLDSEAHTWILDILLRPVSCVYKFPQSFPNPVQSVRVFIKTPKRQVLVVVLPRRSAEFALLVTFVGFWIGFVACKKEGKPSRRTRRLSFRFYSKSRQHFPSCASCGSGCVCWN